MFDKCSIEVEVGLFLIKTHLQIFHRQCHSGKPVGRSWHSQFKLPSGGRKQHYQRPQRWCRCWSWWTRNHWKQLHQRLVKWENNQNNHFNFFFVFFFLEKIQGVGAKRLTHHLILLLSLLYPFEFFSGAMAFFFPLFTLSLNFIFLSLLALQ